MYATYYFSMLGHNNRCGPLEIHVLEINTVLDYEIKVPLLSSAAKCWNLE